MWIRHTIIWLALLQVTMSASVAREWVDITGKHRVEAEFVVLRGDKVVLELSGGKIISLPVNQLSSNDQKYLKEHRSGGVSKPPRSDGGEALLVLKKHCVRCHGGSGSDEGGFDHVVDRDKLVASGYIINKDETASPLFKRLVSVDSPMPPEGEPRPSKEEVDLIRDWIRSGAPDPNPKGRPTTITHRELFKQIALDLSSIDKRDEPFTRYFTLLNLANRGASSDELATYRSALAKLLNSLSWNRQLISLRSVDKTELTFRIDLRDLQWNFESWNQVLETYPHAVVPLTESAKQSLLSTKTDVPVVRADWFIAFASRPPLYHALAQIPQTDAQLEKLLRVDAKQDIVDGRLIRAGFSRSGVSQNNRMIERHESVFGAYWKSYDFSGNTGRKNLFQFPLGPDARNTSFRHDGGEIIFRLPNGMFGYMLTDGRGRRIDKGPTEIVSDPRQPDKSVVNGVSCMSCHYGGLLQKSDEIRRHVLANRGAYRDVDEILNQYQDSGTIERWIEKDTKDYLIALGSEEVGIRNPTRANEPIVLTANQYGKSLDLSDVSAELGIPAKIFQRELSRINDVHLMRTIGALKVPGGVIKRESFDAAFAALATMMKIGRVFRLPSRVASSTVESISSGRLSNQGESTQRDAAAAFSRGTKQAALGKSTLAQTEFETAIELSDENEFKALVFESSLIPIYEKGESVNDLMSAYVFLLDFSQNPTEIKLVVSKLFRSLMDFSNHSKVTSSKWNEHQVYGTQIELPVSVSSVVAAVFEKRLQDDPKDEASLRVMQFYLKHVRDDNAKRLGVLSGLNGLRADALDSREKLDLANLQCVIGDPRTGAELLAKLAKEFSALERMQIRMTEAKAWSRIAERDKAVEALNQAVVQLRAVPPSYKRSYVRGLVDEYVNLGERGAAIDVLASAIKLEKDGTEIGRLQDQIRQITEMQNDSVQMNSQPADLASGSFASGDSSISPTKREGSSELGVLDPKLVLRAEAERAEKDARSMPTYRFRLMAKAAANWIQADEKQKAVAALSIAVATIRRKPTTNLKRDYETLADLYGSLEMKHEAFSFLILALKNVRAEYEIENLQMKLKALQAEESSLTVAGSDRVLLDPKFRYRFAATDYEKRATGQPLSKAMTFIQAAQSWEQAGDVKEVQRCGKLAELELSKVPKAEKYGPQESLYAKLSMTYQNAALHEQAIRCFINAVIHATSDRNAMKYHGQAKALSEQHGLVIPTLAPEIAVKLDPLNEHRVKAREYEERARTSTSSSNRYWKSASESWLKAEELKRAVAAYDEHVKLMLAKPRTSSYEFARAGEFYVKLKQPQRAIKAYEEALKKTESKSGKRRYEEAIDTIKSM